MVGFFMDIAQKLFAKEKLLVSRAFYQSNADRIENILSYMEDEQSRAAYRALIRYRCHRRRRDIRPYMQKKETSYLDRELIVPSDNEVFADCGAFSGDSSLGFQAFCAAAGKQAPLCVLFEPDPDNYALLQAHLPEFINKPLTLQIGLWREAGRLHFTSGLSSSSRIEETGASGIDVDTLDHILEGISELPPVTYMKIDVEGADLDIIYGAQKTIQAVRPRIAVAIYHSDAHMLEIPEAIHDICPSYRFYVRHYSCCEAETVLYCL